MDRFEIIEEELKDKRREEVAEELEGLEIIGSGVSRAAYRIVSERFGKDYRGKVIKFGSMDPEYRRQNMKEFKTWMAVKSSKVAREFSPIRERDENYRWLVMDYAEPIESFFSSLKWSRKLSRKEKRMKMAIETASDTKKANMGIHEKLGLVFIDYPWGADYAINEYSSNECKLRKLYEKLNNLVNRL